MNFIAIIGIVSELIKVDGAETSTLRVKVEKPFVENPDDEWFEQVDVKLDKDVFKKELSHVCDGSVVGIKGRLHVNNNQLELIGERLQVF